MLDLSYFMPTRIIYGPECVEKHAKIFSDYGSRCIIITGSASAKVSGALDDVTNSLSAQGISFLLFDEIEQNPLLSTCCRAGKAAREYGAHFIIGIGGGSPLDAAKAISVYAANQIPPEGLFEGNYGHPPLPVLLVGTTAGTGSEVTPYAVLTCDDNGRKRSVGNLSPAVCFGDYRYTRSLGYAFTVSTALDALAHCAEGYFCTQSNTLSDLFAIEGIRLVLDVLVNLSPGGVFTDNQRKKLYAASLYGGLVITKTTTSFCHAMGYFLTEEYGIAHGTACAVFLPHYLRRGFEYETRKADKLMYETDFTLSELCNLIESFTDFTPFPLDEQKKQELFHRWNQNGKYKNAPGNCTAEDLMTVLEDLFPPEDVL